MAAEDDPSTWIDGITDKLGLTELLSFWGDTAAFERAAGCEVG